MSKCFTEVVLDYPGAPTDVTVTVAVGSGAYVAPFRIKGMPGWQAIRIDDSGERTAQGVPVWRPVSWLKVGK